MNTKFNLKYFWLTIGVLAMILMLFMWLGFESQTLKNSVFALDVLMFILSLPCSLFFVPVAAAADYYLEIGTFSDSGIYLNTIFLFVIGLLQWFWIANFWYPAQSVFQKLDLRDAENK